MMKISIANVEKLIFYNKALQDKIPEMAHIFKKWRLGIKSGVKNMAKDALIEFINNVTNEQLGKLFDFPVRIERLNSHIIKNSVTNIYDDIDFSDGFNISIFRQGELIYICEWR